MFLWADPALFVSHVHTAVHTPAESLQHQQLVAEMHQETKQCASKGNKKAIVSILTSDEKFQLMQEFVSNSHHVSNDHLTQTVFFPQPQQSV